MLYALSVPIFFIMSIKWELKLCVLVRMSVVVITLKIFFSSSLITSFYLDAMYWADLSLAFLMINTSNLFIKKQISDEVAILVCSEYFLDCPQLCLTRAKEAKGISSAGVSVQDAKNVSFNGASARGDYVGVELLGISGWSVSIDILSIKYGFINMFLNLFGPYGSSIVTNSFYILKRL